jgi:hypothetical protein
MLDNKTIGIFITRKPQVIAFQKLDLTILINIFTTRNHKIRFGKKKIMFIGTI